MGNASSRSVPIGSGFNRPFGYKRDRLDTLRKKLSCQLLNGTVRQYFMGMDIGSAQELLHQIWEPNETWTGLMHSVALQLQGRMATQDLQQSLIDPNQFT